MADYFAAEPEATKYLANPANANDYVNALYDRAKKVGDDQTMQAAGQQYATGNYGGAATTLANSGNIPAAQQIQQQGQAANSAGMQALIRAYPIFEGIAQKTAAYGPQAQSQALRHAFATYRQELKATTGISDQVLDSIDQSFATDPQGTLDRFKAMMPTEFKTVGDSLVGIQGNTVTPAYEGSKYMAQPVGNGRSQIVQVGGAAGSPPSPQAPPGAATPQQPPVQSGTAFSEADAQQAAKQLGFQITSGQRTAQHNAAIGGAPNSDHISGLAADVAIPAGAGPGYADHFNAQLAENGLPGHAVYEGSGSQYSTGPHLHWDWSHGVGSATAVPPEQQPPQGPGSPTDQVIVQSWGQDNFNKWAQAGRHWAQLPRGIRDSIGMMAFNGSIGGASSAIGGAPRPLTPQAQGGARVVSAAPPASPIWRDATPDEKAQGVWQVNTETGQKSRETVAQSAAASPVDAAVDYFIQSGGKFPPGMRNPATSLRILEGAKAVAAKSGQKLSDIIGFGAERAANAATLTQLTSLRGKIGTYISTFDKNLDSLRSVIPKGAAGSAPIINRWVQAGRKEIKGDPDVARLNTWMTAVRDEYARILSGATGGAGITDAARSEADGIISKIDSIPAMYATLDAMHSESRNRVNSLDTAISDLRVQLRSGSPTKPQAPQPQQKQSGGNSGGGKVIRYDAQGNRVP